MKLIITSSTDGCDPMHTELSLPDESVARIRSIRRNIFTFLQETIGEITPGTLADECINELFKYSMFLETAGAWFHYSAPGSQGECVAYWIVVELEA